MRRRASAHAARAASSPGGGAFGVGLAAWGADDKTAAWRKARTARMLLLRYLAMRIRSVSRGTTVPRATRHASPGLRRRWHSTLKKKNGIEGK